MVLTAFAQRRIQVLQELAQQQGDKSRKGSVDAPIADLVHLINDSRTDVYTTSSCSGRISVFGEPNHETRAAKKKGGEWLYVTHDTADAEKLLQQLRERVPSGCEYVFRYEPFILALECDCVESAQRVVEIARVAGYRESGITAGSRVIAGIRCSIRLEAPIAAAKQLLVPQDYIRHLVAVANRKQKDNWERIDRFQKLLAAAWAGTQGPIPLPRAVQQAKQSQTDGKESKVLQVDTQNGNLGCPAESERGRQKDKGAIADEYQALCQATEHAHSVEQSPLTWLPILPHDKGSSSLLRRWGHASCRWRNYVVVVGGYVGGAKGAHARSADVLLYDTGKDFVKVLQVKGVSPCERVGHAAVVLGDELILIGGRRGPGASLGDLWTCNLATALETGSATWHQHSHHAEPALGTSTHAKAANAAAGLVSGMGPRPGPPEAALVAAERSVAAEQDVALPPRHRHSAVVFGNNVTDGCVVVFGGCCDGHALSDTWTLDTATWAWKQVPTTGEAPGPRYSHAAAAHGPYMFVHGGRAAYDKVYSDLRCLHVQRGQWKLLQCCNEQQQCASSRHRTQCLSSSQSGQTSAPGSQSVNPCPSSSQSEQLEKCHTDKVAPEQHIGSCDTPPANAGTNDFASYSSFACSCCSEAALLPDSDLRRAADCEGVVLLSSSNGSSTSSSRHRRCCPGPRFSHTLSVIPYQPTSDNAAVADTPGMPSASSQSSYGTEIRCWEEANAMLNSTVPAVCTGAKTMPELAASGFCPGANKTSKSIVLASCTAHSPRAGRHGASVHIVLVGGCPAPSLGGDVWVTTICDMAFEATQGTSKGATNAEQEDAVVWCQVHVNGQEGNLPFPVRHTCTPIMDRLYMVGGGAFCFSFGSVFGASTSLPIPPVLAAADAAVSMRRKYETHGLPRHQLGSSSVSEHDAEEGPGNTPMQGWGAVKTHPKDGVKDGGGDADCTLDTMKHITNVFCNDGRTDAVCKDRQTDSVGKDRQADGKMAPNAFVVLRSRAQRAKAALKEAGLIAEEYRSLQLRLQDQEAIALPLHADAPTALRSGEPVCGDDGSMTACGDNGNAADVSVLQGMLTSGEASLQLLPLEKRGGLGAAKGNPAMRLRLAIDALVLEHTGKPLSAALLPELPTKWERLGDLVLIPSGAFSSAEWARLVPGPLLWEKTAQVLAVPRLARQMPVAATGTRDSQAVLLRGDNGRVSHKEGGIIYTLDITKCMFSSGNVTERTRMGTMPAAGEVVVDLFAGIGFFTLPFLVKGGAAHVYACEWNPWALLALRDNLVANGVADRCTVLEGDCRQVAPQGVADRVSLGLLPSSECGWCTALMALKRNQGGWLHLHANVKDTEESSSVERTVQQLNNMAEGLGRLWKITCKHVERVKWYAPHIRHVVLDICCAPRDDHVNDIDSTPPTLSAVSTATAGGPLSARPQSSQAPLSVIETAQGPSRHQEPCHQPFSQANSSRMTATTCNALPNSAAAFSPTTAAAQQGPSPEPSDPCVAMLAPPGPALHTTPAPVVEGTGYAADAEVSGSRLSKPQPQQQRQIQRTLWQKRWCDLHSVRQISAPCLPTSASQFQAEVASMRCPVLLQGLNLGACLEKWREPAYFQSSTRDADRLVSAHVCRDQNGRMTFVPQRNFEFQTMPLKDLVKLAAATDDTGADRIRYYLRSVGCNPRKEPSDLSAAFPALAVDIHLPLHLLPKDSVFSTVLRISSGGLQLWPHYDVMDNLLIQVTGTKRVLLWPPSQEAYLHHVGSSSPVTDMDGQTDDEQYPLFKHAHRLEVLLKAGETLFIPALWYHCVQALDFSISVNVFWRNLDSAVYARKDLYGNRDLAASSIADEAYTKIVESLQHLPQDYQRFYAARLVTALEKQFAV